MIGKISIGKGFTGCITYCLEGKNGEKSKDAEILYFNNCFGDKRELIEQIKDVRLLNRRIQKPVWHTSLSFDPTDQVSKNDLIEISQEFAKHFDLQENQYLVVQHHDTAHKHIHVIANRVGFDGKANSTNQNYRKMAEFCRQMEKKYALKEVLSPNRFLNQSEQKLSRKDHRKTKLKNLITETIGISKSFDDFKIRMQNHGYKLDIGRGIAFIDDKHVRFKGSQVGFSLGKIKNSIENNLKNETQIIRKSLNKNLEL